MMEAEKSISSDVWQVLLPLPLKDCFDYKIPPALDPVPGAYVRLPFGKTSVVGVLWKKGGSGVAESKLRAATEKLTLPPVSPETMKFIDWVAAYTMNPRGAILKMMMSERSVFAISKRAPKKSPAPLDYLYHPPETILEPQQQRAAEELIRKVDAGGYSATLLEGVTGSGKTEVYFQAISEALRQHKQILVLLPEIGLSTQWLRRFQDAFGAPPVVWHSDLKGTERKRNWLAITNGQAKVIVGARSALFLPYRDLGLIVVDEEHENAFKQEEGVLYHARDMAVVRAHLQQIPVVLASATPSLETVANVEAGKYARLHLPERYNEASLPSVQLVDLRTEKLERGRFIGKTLADALADNLQKQQQSLLFLNRRGYAPLTLCRKCGFRIQCKQCSAWMVEHARTGQLACHHCGYHVPKPKSCPQCKTENTLHPIGPGVERIEEEVKKLFPAARVAQMSSDAADSPQKIAELVQALEIGEIDIVIGTQMIAKGYHFPRLTLVGVVDADLGLAGGDLRAAERTYQLLLQVAGRSGRSDLAGRVILQTFQPDHPVLDALSRQDGERFIELQLEERKLLSMPPFTRLASIVIAGRELSQVKEHATKLARSIPQGIEGLKILGPAPAPLALLRGKHRERFLVKSNRNLPLQDIIAKWLNHTPAPRSLRVQVDIDPYNFV